MVLSDPIFTTLDPDQRRAVLHDGGPLLLVAGAGSGKTRAIVARIVRLLRDGVPARSILGITFTNIGLRLKGNSSLLNSWRSGSDKLPFRLNADGLEDQRPESRDQTFFGFPNLNLTNNSQDASFLRAKVVGDLFREAGVPAENLFVYPRGATEWIANGLPLETGPRRSGRLLPAKP